MVDYQSFVWDMIRSLIGQQNTINVSTVLIDYTGSYEGAGFFSQVLYWSDRGRNGWFYKTYGDWWKELRIKEDQLRSIAKKLEDRGIIKRAVKKIGNGSVAVHYCIVRETFERDFSEFLQSRNLENQEPKPADSRNRNRLTAGTETGSEQGSKPADSRNLYNNITYKQNLQAEPTSRSVFSLEKTLSASADGVCSLNGNGFHSSGEQINPQDIKPYSYQSAEKLYSALVRRRKIVRRPSLHQWSNDIKKFFQCSDVTNEEFSRVLDWYVQHIGDQYVPRAYSAKTFCDKFVQLLDASGQSNGMSRDEFIKQALKGKEESDAREREYRQREAARRAADDADGDNWP